LRFSAARLRRMSLCYAADRIASSKDSTRLTGYASLISRLTAVRPRHRLRAAYLEEYPMAGAGGKDKGSGWTDLLYGARVRKDDSRIEALGALDELNCRLGLVKSLSPAKRLRDLIHSCQRNLITVSGEFACLPRDLKRLKPRVNDSMVARLERETRALKRRVRLKQRGFAIPGENAVSAQLDICRCLARTAERRAVTLKRKGAVPNPNVAAYLNRLSELLYLLARQAEGKPR
jgi:cob(I)alamin adenosyltransferase